MNWLLSHLIKEAKGRKFSPNDKVRYFTENRKGKGKGVILTPSFSKGTVVDFDSSNRRYKVKNNNEEIIDVHPRNLIPDSISYRPTPIPEVVVPEVSMPEVSPVSEVVDSFPR